MLFLETLLTDLPVEKIGIVGVYTLILIFLVLVFCYKIIKYQNKNQK